MCRGICSAGARRVFCILDLFALTLAAGAGVFTVQVGPRTAPASKLVGHQEVWRYHKGTNAPAAGWQTTADTALDASWLSGAGGFGYADNLPELAAVQTPLADMQNGYSTVYIRRAFEITNAVDPAEPLQLVIDWDDGFVAWLDGAELAPRVNAPGAAGTEPAFNATATATHESSLGNGSPQPVMTYSLGQAGNRLGMGTHVLAILGLNQAINSSDCILVADLLLGGGGSGVINGELASIVRSNSVALSGTNSIPGAARVVVNGADAVFDAGRSAWSSVVSLKPGLNRLLLQVMDASGVQLYATNRDVISEPASTSFGGTLAGNISLTRDSGVFQVTNSVVLAPGSTLSIGPGCVFLLSPGASFLVTNATLTVSGTETEPVVFAPADGSTVWGGLIGSGPGAKLRAQHTETVGGHLQFLDGAQAEFEDSYFHDYTVSSPPILSTLGQPRRCAVTFRGCHFNRYYEILCQLSTNRFEDCLMEYQAQGGDGIDFDAGQPGSFIRRCTVRHGKFTNVDALDMGEFGSTGEPSRGVLIDSCLLYDFVDKGVSMGVQVDVTVTNCLMHHLDSGIAVKDLSTAGIYNCTLVSNNFGFHCYNKANPSAPTGGGYITNSFNNILWGNGQALSLANGSLLTASYSDFQGVMVPGPGNLNADPGWTNPAGDDYRTGPDSPVIAAGLDGATMGAKFPVGAPMAASHPVLGSVEVLGTNAVVRFWADSERSYSLLRSDAVQGGSWTKIADVFTAPISRQMAITNTTSADAQYYRLVTPRLP